jgi:hypothetical protein
LGREVLIVPSALREVDHSNKVLSVNLMREQIENSPPTSSKLPVSRQYEQQYFDYYGWVPYWDTAPLAAPVQSVPPPNRAEKPGKLENPHLRSSDEVIGYRLQAKDDDLGRVTDLLLDEQTWSIRYLVVDTGHWFSGKNVLVSPSWIVKIDWAQSFVEVNLSVEKIKTAPAYDPEKPIDVEYERMLQNHYGHHENSK